MRPALAALVGLMTLISACSPVPSRTAQEVVDLFHQALQAGDSARALSLTHEDLLVLEAGGAERSRDEYAAHHLAADIAFSTGTLRSVQWQQVQVKGDLGWVASLARISGAHEGRPVNQQVAETMLLRREQGEWKIAHIHWSARRVPQE